MTLQDSEYRKTPDQNYDFLQIRYTDLPGRFLAKYVAGQQLDGVGVDGSSVRGFAKIDDSDLLLVPDKSTIRPAPISNYKVLTAIADIHEGFGRGRLTRDPRFVSQLLEEHLASEGLTCSAGPEVECFIFDDIIYKDKDSPDIISSEGIGKYNIRRKGGYDAPPFQDSLMEFRFEIAEILEKNYFVKVTNLNHEVASCGQMEINFMHSTLTKAADNVQRYKDVVRTVAKKYNKIANFMPKPIFDEKNRSDGASDNGSGMHVNISLWAGDKNVFYDGMDNYAEISQVARYFIGGVLDHIASLSAIVNPTVNSYHRIVPGFEAPVYPVWSKGNRSAVVRVPVNDRNNAKSKRIEFRAPDPSANPYLALSAIVAAGLDGIRKKIEPGDPVSGDIFKLSDHAKAALGIKTLPARLQEALDALKTDQNYLSPCFKGDLIETYIGLKSEDVALATTKGHEFMLYHDI